MTRAAAGGQVRPRSGAAGAELLWWLIPAGFVLVVAASTAALLGGMSRRAVRARLHRPAWRVGGAVDLVRHAAVWPGVPAGLLWGCAVVVFALFCAVAALPVVLVVRGARRSGRRRGRWPPGREVAALHTARAAEVALRLRPALAAEHGKAARVPDGQRG